MAYSFRLLKGNAKSRGIARTIHRKGEGLGSKLGKRYKLLTMGKLGALRLPVGYAASICLLRIKRSCRS